MFQPWESKIQSQLDEFATQKIKEREELKSQLEEANKDFNANKIISKLKPRATYPTPYADFTMNIPNCGCAVQKDPSLKAAEKRLEDFGWGLVDVLLKLFSEMSDDDFKKFKENYHQQIRQDSKGCDEPGNSDREKGSGEGNEVVNCGEGSPNC